VQASVQLSNSNDTRTLSQCAKRNDELQVAALYKLSFGGHAVAPFASFIWDSFAPLKARFFCWLLVQDKIQSRAALH
jgi:hypothetical protein